MLTSYPQTYPHDPTATVSSDGSAPHLPMILAGMRPILTDSGQILTQPLRRKRLGLFSKFRLSAYLRMHLQRIHTSKKRTKAATFGHRRAALLRRNGYLVSEVHFKAKRAARSRGPLLTSPHASRVF